MSLKIAVLDKRKTNLIFKPIFAKQFRIFIINTTFTQTVTLARLFAHLFLLILIFIVDKQLNIFMHYACLLMTSKLLAGLQAPQGKERGS